MTAAAKACRTFIFSLSLSPLFFFPSPLSFSRSAFLLCPARPCSRLLVHCLPPHHAGGSAKAAMWWRRRWRKKSLTQRLLFASFVIPLIFLPARRERPPRRAAPLPSFAALFLLLPLLPFFFHCLLFFSHAVRIPSPDCNSAGLSAPRIAVYFYCDVLPPPPPAYPPSAPFPASPTSTDARARVLFIRVAPAFFHLSFFLSFFFSFFLSARCSRCPWSVILRRGGDENARLGLRAVASSFCRRFLPPSASSSYSIRFRSFLAPFFFSFLPSRAVLISRVRALRSRDREKY